MFLHYHSMHGIQTLLKTNSCSTTNFVCFASVFFYFSFLARFMFLCCGREPPELQRCRHLMRLLCSRRPLELDKQSFRLYEWWLYGAERKAADLVWPIVMPRRDCTRFCPRMKNYYSYNCSINNTKKHNILLSLALSMFRLSLPPR